MKIRKALLEAKNILQKANIESPAFESRLLLSHISGLSMVGVTTRDGEELSSSQQERFFRLVEKRSEQYPVAYLTGSKEFFSLKFEVDPSVLIPRPETEELIEWVLKENRKSDSLLDLCTGSGCIGITMAMHCSVNNLTLSDVSENALALARSNAQNLLKSSSTDISFVKSDLFQNISGQFDLIITNPPYVLPSEYDRLMDDVRLYEPFIALVVEEPVSFFTSLLNGAKNVLRPEGWLYMETNPLLIEETRKIMEEMGYAQIMTKSDLAGKRRFIRAQKPS